MEHIGE